MGVVGLKFFAKVFSFDNASPGDFTVPTVNVIEDVGGKSDETIDATGSPFALLVIAIELRQVIGEF